VKRIKIHFPDHKPVEASAGKRAEISAQRNHESDDSKRVVPAAAAAQSDLQAAAAEGTRGEERERGSK